MKILILFLFISLSGLSLTAQATWNDTAKTTVNLKGFKLTNKIVKAEYGKVNMFFNQSDYLKKEEKKDTVIITPKYFDDNTIADLLKKGQVKILRRSDNSIETEITHYLKQTVSMVDRIFELHDGVGFFSHLEIMGLEDVYDLGKPDTANIARKKTKTQVEKIKYEETFPNIIDTTTIKIKDYFPAKPSFHYVYDLNNGYGESDTNICKVGKLNDKDIFYFAECYDKYNIVVIGSTVFGCGIYFYQNDSLYTIEADYEKDIKAEELGAPALLIPALIKPGDSTTLDLRTDKKVFTFLKREDLTIGNVKHYDCIKLKIKDYWDHSIYLGYIWLEKNVGLIKWMRDTGRVDEMVNGF